MKLCCINRLNSSLGTILCNNHCCHYYNGFAFFELPRIAGGFQMHKQKNAPVSDRSVTFHFSLTFWTPPGSRRNPAFIHYHIATFFKKSVSIQFDIL